MAESIRLQILRHLQTAFLEAGNDPVYDVDPYVITLGGQDTRVTFSTVELGSLLDADMRKRFSIGIVAGKETKSALYPLLEAIFSVAVEFRVVKNANDEKPAILAEQMLAVVQRIIAVNRTMGGLAVDTLETGNEIDLTSYADRSVMGVVFLEVRYRHAFNDVTDPTARDM